MTENERSEYSKRYNVRPCAEKRCGNCRFFERIGFDAGCLHEAQRDFDVEDYGKREDPWYMPKDYGAPGDGIYVDEGMVCGLWEASVG